jgi:hypothetical protein
MGGTRAFNPDVLERGAGLLTDSADPTPAQAEALVEKFSR